VLKRLVDAYPDHVQFVYRHLPLTSIHDNAHKAAEAAEAAAEQATFWPYHDLLFERIGEWSGLGQEEAEKYFVGLAEELGLNAVAFAEQLDEGVYAEYVSALQEEAFSLGLTSTPSALIDGQPIDRLPADFEVWDSFVHDRVAIAMLEERQYQEPPPMTIDVNSTYSAIVKLESGEEIVIGLLPKSAPLTVNSFVFLANEGFYDGVTFHRVVPGFVAQTGDPSATGLGGPGYQLPNEIDPELSHSQPGVVAMANSGPDTNGSQWYITFGDASQLDGSYTIFGQVLEGMDAVQNITPRDPSQTSYRTPGDMIKEIVVEEG
jgi:cyclophilin family peptidyl-prolyl cis-trans isomerase